MWKTIISSFVILAALTLMTGLQSCTNRYYDNGDLDRAETHKPNSGFYGGPYSGSGPAGQGVQ